MPNDLMDPISASLTQSLLGQQPSKVGCRLRSEPDLAKMFNVRRWKIRKAIGQLEQLGVVSRRKGSGTYLRRVDLPSDLGVGSEVNETSTLLFQGDELFADNGTLPDNPRSRQSPPRAQQGLRLGLWSVLHCSTIANQTLLAGIVAKRTELGHHLAIHNISRKDGTHLSATEIAEQLHHYPEEGYLVDYTAAEVFSQACQLAHPQTPPKVVYFAPCNCSVKREPLITMDANESVRRAIALLADEGYQRIGLIAYDNGINVPMGRAAVMEAAYADAMVQMGLDYRATVFTDIPQSRQVVRNLLTGPNPPDALYVADDYVFMGVAEELDRQGLTPGKDIGIITLSSIEHHLPAGHKWSCLQFDHEYQGQILVTELARMLQTGGQGQNLSIQAQWKPGETHRRKR